MTNEPARAQVLQDLRRERPPYVFIGPVGPASERGFVERVKQEFLAGSTWR